MFLDARWGETQHLKCSLEENILAQQMTDITCSLCSLQIPFIDAYMGMDPRGILKCSHTTVTMKQAVLLKCR